MDCRGLVQELVWAFSPLTAVSVFTKSFDAHSVTKVLCVCVCVCLRQLVFLENTHTSSNSQAEINKRHSDPRVKLRVTVEERYL